MSSEKKHDGFGSAKYAQVLNNIFKTSKNATYAWVIYTSLYWTGLTIIPAIIREDLGSYSFVLWWLGMIGVCSVYYAVQAGYPATSKQGKPIMAFANLMVSAHWSAIAFDALDSQLRDEDMALMFFHSITILWASLFFYEKTLSSGRWIAWMTLVVEWIDLILIGVAIAILSDDDGSCTSDVVCMGYFVVLIIHLICWFLPIMFGMAESARALHLHMIILDSVTDLPIVIIVIAKSAYRDYPFLFFDVSWKIFLLVRSYGYHGLYHLVLNSPSDDDVQKQTEEQQQNS